MVVVVRVVGVCVYVCVERGRYYIVVGWGMSVWWEVRRVSLYYFLKVLRNEVEKRKIGRYLEGELGLEKGCFYIGEFECFSGYEEEEVYKEKEDD